MNPPEKRMIIDGGFNNPSVEVTEWEPGNPSVFKVYIRIGAFGFGFVHDETFMMSSLTDMLKNISTVRMGPYSEELFTRELMPVVIGKMTWLKGALPGN